MLRTPLELNSTTLPSCQCERVHPRSFAMAAHPVIVASGPLVHAARREWREDRFVARFALFHHVVKDELVRPAGGELEVLNSSAFVHRLQSESRNLLWFTNDQENPEFMEALAPTYEAAVPAALAAVDGFRVFSAGTVGSSHSRHAHRESWLLQLSGRKVWWFQPPGSKKLSRSARGNGCSYFARPPAGSTVCVQSPGELVYFPKDWFHATCMLDRWSAGVGAQGGQPTVPGAVTGKVRRALLGRQPSRQLPARAGSRSQQHRGSKPCGRQSTCTL